MNQIKFSVLNYKQIKNELDKVDVFCLSFKPKNINFLLSYFAYNFVEGSRSKTNIHIH